MCNGKGGGVFVIHSGLSLERHRGELSVSCIHYLHVDKGQIEIRLHRLDVGLSVSEAISHFTRLECLRITHASRVSMVRPTRTRRRHEADQDQAPSVNFDLPLMTFNKLVNPRKKELRSLCSIHSCRIAARDRVRHFGLQARLEVLCGCAGSLGVRLDSTIKRWEKQLYTKAKIRRGFRSPGGSTV